MRIEGLLTQAAASRKLGVSRARVNQMLNEKLLTSEGVGGVVFVTTESLDKLMACRAKAPASSVAGSPSSPLV